MEECVNLEISYDTIQSMIEINPELKDLSREDIIEKVCLLEEVQCDTEIIRNIISSNPQFLSRTIKDVVKLLNYLLKIGFKNLNLLLDSNPYILNLDDFEIENYINKRKSNGDILTDIIDDLEENPHLFNEI